MALGIIAETHKSVYHDEGMDQLVDMVRGVACVLLPCLSGALSATGWRQGRLPGKSAWFQGVGPSLQRDI